MSDVVETAIADVQVDDEGIPEQVNDYLLSELLGEGAYAKVFKCSKADQEYAMKVINKSFLKRKKEYKRVNGKMVISNAFQKVQKEVAIMKKLSHQNITKLYEVIDSPEQDKLFLVLEYISGGQAMYWDSDTLSYFDEATNGPASEEMVQCCAADLILGIEYLHANNICHRDIKPENVLVSSDKQYKLGDFGVAHMFEHEEMTTLRNTEGTYHFLAPECLLGGEFDPFKADLWAIGVTLFSMLFGVVPFGRDSIGINGIIDSIKTEELVFPTSISSDCEALLRGLLNRNSEKRMDIQQVKNHPWIKMDIHLQGRSYPPIEQVVVSELDIDLAFTPVNNFMLMSVLKVRMASKLAKARKNIDRRQKKLLERPDDPKSPNGKRDRNESEERVNEDKKNKNCIIS